MNFEDWNKETDSLCPRRAFDAAFNYQQAKISILQIKLNGADERADAVLNHKNKMIDGLQAKIDELQIKIAFQEKAIKNIKLQFENKQIDCDRSDRKIEELQARNDYLSKKFNDLARLILDECEDILKGNKYETVLN